MLKLETILLMKFVPEQKCALTEQLKRAVRTQVGHHDSTGSKGNGVAHLIVFYQKTCQICKKTPITKITLAQRGTYYCNKCQK